MHSSRTPSVFVLLIGTGVFAGCNLLSNLDGLSVGPMATTDTDAGATRRNAKEGQGELKPEFGGDEVVDAGAGIVRDVGQANAIVVVGGRGWDGGGGDPFDLQTFAIARTSGGLGAFEEEVLPSFAPEGTSFRVVAAGNKVFVVTFSSTYVGTLDRLGKKVVWSIHPGIERNDVCVASVKSLAGADSVVAIGGRGYASEVSVASTTTTTTAIAWTATSPLPVGRSLHGCAGSDRFVYAGGGNGTSMQERDELFYAERLPSGGLSAWKQTTPLPKPAVWPRLIVVGGSRLFIIGAGFYGADARSVFSANIQADGSIGPWQLHSSLPEVIDFPAVVTTGDRIFVLGGSRANVARTEVFTSTVDATSGSITPWITTTPLPTPRSDLGGAAIMLP
jgi:hypothetical protein